ncbi:hypothetical protein N7467_004878 [Penicillium canescens]|nr:hypothetical protein N7467_004878 [Penicillium canescens]
MSDVFGPVDCLNVLSWSHNLTLSLLSSTLDPVTTKAPISPIALGQSLVPTHTFATAPTLDLLLVPGGLGTRVPCPGISDAIAYIRATYPSLKYLVTVCTGSILASRAGVLDGKRATTNKMAWATTVAYPGVRWIPRARWVVDGNVWSSSGLVLGLMLLLLGLGMFMGRRWQGGLLMGWSILVMRILGLILLLNCMDFEGIMGIERCALLGSP